MFSRWSIMKSFLFGQAATIHIGTLRPNSSLKDGHNPGKSPHGLKEYNLDHAIHVAGMTISVIPGRLQVGCQVQRNKR